MQCRINAEDPWNCLLYTSDAADERSSVDLGGRRNIKKKKTDITDTHTDELMKTREQNSVQQSKDDNIKKKEK